MSIRPMTGQHGICAGVKDCDDFFTQICGIASHPVSLMTAQKTFSGMQSALKSAGIEVFNVDTVNEQLELSACLDSATGKWKLSPVASEIYI